MSFGRSAYLTHLHSPAAKSDIAAEIDKLLFCIGQSTPELVDELASRNVNNEVLGELVMWNDRLAPQPGRDRIGTEATKFWVAQTIATTVLRSGALDGTETHSEAVRQVMELGATGLFETGRSQFEALARLAHETLAWIKAKGCARTAIIESPLGNSLPVQVICDIASRIDVNVVPFVWNAPRNDRSSLGQTVDQAGIECAKSTRDYDLVIYMDDVITGTRFLKLFDALADRVGRARFLPLAMAFNDTTRPGLVNHPNRARLVKRLEAQGAVLNHPGLWVDFPLLRLFSIDAGAPVRWEHPVIWGESDLVAGKRKVNLVFTLLDHIFKILLDLGAKKSVYRSYLDAAWSADTSGQRFVHSPGLLESVFANIVQQLDLTTFKRTMWDEAKIRFPEDYRGQFFGTEEEHARLRWDWIRTTFVTRATPLVGESRARVAWRGIDAAFAASFAHSTPKAGRDQDAAPYTIPFNSTLTALNRRLRDLVVGAAVHAGLQP